jgi:hypothetical protein
MSKKKGLIEEFWENAKIPYVKHRATKELFDELNDFLDPRTYVGDGILRSVAKLFTEFLK